MRMLCSRSASLMTRTRGSRAIATTILRTVSAWAASPYLTLSSLVTPSTSSATSSPKSRRRVVQAVARCPRRCRAAAPATSVGRVHAQLGEDRGDGERVRDVRVAALAQLAAVAALGDLVGPLDLPQRRASTFGSLLRTIRSSGSSTGLYGLVPLARRGGPAGRGRGWGRPPERMAVVAGPASGSGGGRAYAGRLGRRACAGALRGRAGRASARCWPTRSPASLPCPWR